jgi:Bacterial regulatory proteins, gntR family
LPQPHQSGLVSAGSTSGTSSRSPATGIPARVFWSPRVARVRSARLLTILLLISRIVPVRGREDATPAQVGRAGGTTPGETTLAGPAGRQLAGERLRQAILTGGMSHGQRLIEAEPAELIGVTRASLRAALCPEASLGEHQASITVITGRGRGRVRHAPSSSQRHESPTRSSSARKHLAANRRAGDHE